jgi:hypothetical protein
LQPTRTYSLNNGDLKNNPHFFVLSVALLNVAKWQTFTQKKNIGWLIK